MGVIGLTSICIEQIQVWLFMAAIIVHNCKPFVVWRDHLLRNLNTFFLFQRIRQTDLFLEADKFEDGIEIVVDYMGFLAVASSVANARASIANTSWMIKSYLGGMYELVDVCVSRFISR